MPDSGLPPLKADAGLVQGGNVFAELLAGRGPVSYVYQDEKVAAFMDIQPINVGHVLVVPLQSARFLHELDDGTAAHLFAIARRVAAAIRLSGLPCEGVNMFLADGAAAGQEVPHVHLHVFPRYAGDGFALKFANRYFNRPARAALDEAAGKIRSALGEVPGI